MNFNRQRGGRGSITHQQQKNKLQNHNSGIGLINQLFADHFKSVKIKELSQAELTELKKSVETGCIGGK
tara:strand:+ start:1380 stop:1586 length:207 start_codon:yes stop_codon:yes gene_type:complete